MSKKLKKHRKPKRRKSVNKPSVVKYVAKASSREDELQTATMLLKSGNYEKALEHYRNLTTKYPDVDSYNGLGIVLEKLCYFDEAIEAYQQAIDCNPDQVEPYNNLGNILISQMFIDRAIEVLEKAISINPEVALIYNNYANALAQKGLFDDAIEAYTQSLNLDPDNKKALYGLGFVLLTKGNLKAGFTAYQAIWHRSDMKKLMRPFTQDSWHGEDLTDKTILIWGDQGIGDQWMFASMIPDVIQKSKKCIIEVEYRQVPIFKRSFPDADFITKKDPPDIQTISAEIDYHSPFSNLARHFREDFSKFPKLTNYLKADDDLTKQIRDRYQSLGDGLIVGISWSTNNTKAYKARNIELQKWKEIFEIPNINFVSLQYGDCKSEIEKINDEIGCNIYYDEEVDPLTNLDDLAAQVNAVDIVISIDNSTVHIAGALGKPVWTLLPYVPDWRWMMEKEDSIWYPSMRLFRQKKQGQWDDVIKKIEKELRDFKVL